MQAFHATVGYFCNVAVDQHWREQLLEELRKLENQAIACQEKDKPPLRARLHAVKENALAQFKEQCLAKFGPDWGETFFVKATCPQARAMQWIDGCWQHVQELLKPDLTPNLSPEIWRHIFSFLPRADLTKLSRVTHRFCAIVYDLLEHKLLLELQLNNHADKKNIPINALSETLNRDHRRYNLFDFNNHYSPIAYRTGRYDLREIFFKRECDRTGTEPPLIFKPIPPKRNGYYPSVVKKEDHYYHILIRVNYFFIQQTRIRVEKPDLGYCDDEESTRIKLEFEKYVLEHYQKRAMS